MINKKYLNTLRSKNTVNSNNFIYDLISKRIIDSIDLLEVKFNNILEIGRNDDSVINYLSKKNSESKFTRSDIVNTELKSVHRYMNLNLDNFSLNNNKFNLIFSNTFLHLSSDFDNILSEIHKSLYPNGFFIAAVPDSDNIFQLVNSMYKTDLDLYNGYYRRMNPTLDINNILNTLKKINFHIPTLNTDNISLEYSDFNKLLNDIRNTKLSYCYNDKKNTFESKDYFKILEKNYKKNYYNENFILNLKINYISAWKK